MTVPITRSGGCGHSCAMGARIGAASRRLRSQHPSKQNPLARSPSLDWYYYYYYYYYTCNTNDNIVYDYDNYYYYYHYYYHYDYAYYDDPYYQYYYYPGLPRLLKGRSRPGGRYQRERQAQKRAASQPRAAPESALAGVPVKWCAGPSPASQYRWCRQRVLLGRCHEPNAVRAGALPPVGDGRGPTPRRDRALCGSLSLR